MRKYILTAFAAVAVIASCNKGPQPGEKYLVDNTLGIVSGGVTVLPATGGEAEIVFDTQERVIASASSDWLDVSFNGNAVTVTAGPNSSIESRYAELTAVAGDKSCSMTVQQMGASTEFTVMDDWSLSADVSEEYAVTVQVTVPEADADKDYYLLVVSADEVVSFGAGTDISLFLSLGNNAEVRKASQPVRNGNVRVDAGVLGRGKYYAIAVCLENGACNYKYADTSFRVYYPYDRWLGVWEVKTGDKAGSWTIKQLEQDASVTITGIAGEEYPVKGVFTGTGEITIASQTNLAKTAGSDGTEYDVDLYGCTGTGYLDQTLGKVLMTLTLGEDKLSATVKSSASNTGFAFFGSQGGVPQIWWGMKEFPDSMTKTRDLD